MSIKIVLQNDRRRRRIELTAITWPAAFGRHQSFCCFDGCVAFIPKLYRHRQGRCKSLDIPPDALGLWTLVTRKTARIPGDNTLRPLLRRQPRDALKILAPGRARDSREWTSQRPRLVAYRHADALVSNVESQHPSHSSGG